MPNLHVMRPADSVECAECWELALLAKHAPTVLAPVDDFDVVCFANEIRHVPLPWEKQKARCVWQRACGRACDSMRRGGLGRGFQVTGGKTKMARLLIWSGPWGGLPGTCAGAQSTPGLWNCQHSKPVFTNWQLARSRYSFGDYPLTVGTYSLVLLTICCCVLIWQLRMPPGILLL